MEAQTESQSAGVMEPQKRLKYTEDPWNQDDLVPTSSADPVVENVESPEKSVEDSDHGSENSDDYQDDESYYDSDDDGMLYEDDGNSYNETASLQAQFDKADLPAGVEVSFPLMHERQTKCSYNVCQASEEEEAAVLKKYKEFKKFETVEDYSDHHYYVKEKKESMQMSKEWAKTIQREWQILEKGLPETIFVRVYEERMDFLRAVIAGAEGTPYHDGLFFFDLHFPPNFPNVPPNAHYHSGGLRLNPNLYNCGKVCLSLLNTWRGRNPKEHWTPGTSTVLQVLLSIQALVLNEKPYFNEPGHERTAGSEQGERESRAYNRNTFVLSCKTMLYSQNNPPKHFEDLIVGHFREHAQAILEACKAYIKGVQVGQPIDSLVQLEEENNTRAINQGYWSGGLDFKTKLRTLIASLVPALIKNGAKDCEKFIFLGDVNRTAPLKLE